MFFSIVLGKTCINQENIAVGKFLLDLLYPYKYLKNNELSIRILLAPELPNL
jgi:hypothetical protein